MYELGSAFPDASVEPGTNVLIAGPPMTGKRSLALDVLAHGSTTGDGSIVVSTKDDADHVLEDYRKRAGDDALIGVVDCVTRQQGMGGNAGEEFVRYTSSPVDLTGIGIELSELLRTFYQEQSVQRNRILLYSLSTLLMYSNLQTVFRFLHVFTGRVQSADGLGLYVIDASAHDEQAMSTIKQLFDGVIEVRETDDGTLERRLAGLPNVDSSWQSF